MTSRGRWTAAIGAVLAVWLLAGQPAPAAEGDSPDAVTAAAAGEETVNLSWHDVWTLADSYHPQVRAALRELESLERTLAQREAAYKPTLTLRGEGPGVRWAPGGDTEAFALGVGLSAGLKLPSGLQLNASINSSQREAGTEDPDSGLRTTVSVSYPLRRSAELDADALALREAAVARDAGRRRVEIARQQARLETLSALREVEAAEALLRLARGAYEEALANHSVVVQQAEIGAATEAQLLAAQLDVLRAEQELMAAERTYQARRSSLLRLLGLTEDGVGYRFPSAWDWLAMPDSGAEDEIMAQAVAASVDVWERQQAVETTALQLAAERERSGLETSLQLSYSASSGQGSQPGWRVGLQASYPLLDGGQRRLNLEAREAAYAQAQEALASAVEQVQDQVADLLFQLEDARRQVEIARLELTRAQLEWTSAQRRLELPVPAATEADVAAARRAVERAEIAWREAVWTYQARWMELQILQGDVDWDALRGGEE